MNHIPALVLQGAAMVASSMDVELVLTQDGLLMRKHSQEDTNASYAMLTWHNLGSVSNPGVLIRRELLRLCGLEQEAGA